MADRALAVTQGGRPGCLMCLLHVVLGPGRHAAEAQPGTHRTGRRGSLVKRCLMLTVTTSGLHFLARTRSRI